MDQQLTRGEQNLLMLQSLISSSEKFYVWCYDAEGRFVATNCPEETRDVLEQAFFLTEGMEKLLLYARESDNTRPRIIGSPIGMQWALSYESERSRRLIFLAGPVFYTAPTERQLRVALRPYTHSRENAAWAVELFRLLPELPVMSYAVFTRYTLMVHNMLTGQQLGLEVFDAGNPGQEKAPSGPRPGRDRSKIYLAERAMLQMVRNGDINYQGIFQNVVSGSPGVPVQGQDPLRQVKTSIIVFTSLVCRAAMEGGPVGGGLPGFGRALRPGPDHVP